MTIAQLAELGGMEGAEIIMWMIMRGALAPTVNLIHKTYYLPSMCAIAALVFEDAEPVVVKETVEEHTKRIYHQLEGIEKLEGTYPYTIEMSVRAYRLTSFLHDLIIPEKRKLFLEREEEAFEQAGLTEEERKLVRERDWQGLIHYGVIFFMLEKLGAVIGVGNIDIYAAMKGMTVPEFQKTRNAQINYSVAGKDAK